jgi:hypothetical protein
VLNNFEGLQFKDCNSNSRCLSGGEVYLDALVALGLNKVLYSTRRSRPAMVELLVRQGGTAQARHLGGRGRETRVYSAARASALPQLCHPAFFAPEAFGSGAPAAVDGRQPG